MAEKSRLEEQDYLVASLAQEINTRWSAIETLDTDLAASWRQITINERSRFRLWSNNLGACYAVENQRSADHRERADLDVQRRIAQLLEELCEVLDDIQEIQSGNREGGEEEEETTATNVSPDSDETTKPVSEISELWLMVGDVVTSLLKASVSVRQSSSRIRFDHAVSAAVKANASSTPTISDVEHVRHVFPKLEAKQWLLQRLGEASMQRRKFLMYARDHERLLAPAKDEDASIPMEALSRARTVPAAKIDISILEDNDGDSATSNTSATLYSAGGSVNDDNTRQIIPLSSVCVDGQPAICPYCRNVVHFNEEEAWRQHVFEDLVAYTCTFEDCDHGPFRSRTAWANHEQRQHLRSWKCPLCHGDFDTHALVAEHVAAIHPSVDRNLLGDLIYAASPQVERVPISQCPFCDDPRSWENVFGPAIVLNSQHFLRKESVSVSLYHRHTSHHMEQLALFAAPAVTLDGEHRATGDQFIAVQSTTNRIPSAPVEITPEYQMSTSQEKPSTDRNEYSSVSDRQWFVPGDGIDRHVIVADIQRYLGHDATVRPGNGTGENDGVFGYWIKAWRNLSAAMIADLRADSATWRQKQQYGTANRGFAGSNTYQSSKVAGAQSSRDRDSEAMEPPFGPSVPGSRDHIPTAHTFRDQYSSLRRYGADAGGVLDTPFGHQPQNSAVYGRSQNPMFARSNAYLAPLIDSAPPGYVRQGNYFVPVSPSGLPVRSMDSTREPRYPLGLVNDLRYPQDPRDILRYQRDQGDPRDTGDLRRGQDYSQDPRYDYPPPANTPSSLPHDERTAVYAAPPGHLRQGGYYIPVFASAPQRSSSTPDQTGPDESQVGRSPIYGRERPTPTSHDSARNARRRM